MKVMNIHDVSSVRYVRWLISGYLQSFASAYLTGQMITVKRLSNIVPGGWIHVGCYRKMPVN
jgi:hypothetical protein